MQVQELHEKLQAALSEGASAKASQGELQERCSKSQQALEVCQSAAQRERAQQAAAAGAQTTPLPECIMGMQRIKWRH